MKSRLVELALRAVSFLSIPTQRRLGRWLGRRLYKKQGWDYRITLRNIQACFPQMPAQDRETLTRKSLEATSTMAIETPAVWFRGKGWRDKAVVAVECQALFDEALASGRGIVLLVPHFGNWELIGQWTATFRSVTALYRTPKIAALDHTLRKAREQKSENETVPASPRGVLALVKALSKGGMTIILPDQQPAPEGGIFSPFFGVQALTMTLANRLFVKTQPVVLFAYARRVQDGFVIGFDEPDAEVYSADPQISVDAMNRSIEKLVLTAPEQYQWEYKRFRRQPDGEQNFYS